MKQRAITLAIVLATLTGLVVMAGALSVTAQAPSPALAPGPSAKPIETTPPASPTPTPTPAPSPKVITTGGHLELDEVIQVEVEHFTEWAATNDATKLVPFINGRAIRGNYPEEIHPDKNRLHFHLEINPANKEVWTDLLGEPSGLRRQVTFTIGLETQSPFDSVYGETNRLPLTVISPLYGVIAAIVFLFTLILFLWLARTTNLIRETGPCPVPEKLRPYNLGRTQMAFWFFMIYASYFSIWLITDALDTITPSLLALMGISAGTALGEALIDSGSVNANSDQLRSATSEKQSLEQSVPELQAQIDALNNKTSLAPEDTSNRDSLNKQLQDSRTRLAQLNQQIQSLTPSAASGVSKGFVTDILSDGSGYTFHRFQIFAWTIVLGIIFASSVYNNLTMPEFSATLLGLMGISSGTYIGFKFPETK